MLIDLRHVPPNETIELVCRAEDAPVLSGLVCRARPCGSAEHGRFRVVVVDPNMPTVHVPAAGPDVVSER